ncbi:DegT/DnrJ/EryC1/StrS aminotransferase family protein [uncultured Tenacibaculum sp.]|uniref:DegT/DnrJ/EryC1/StrS family aminotransferase n=1 Tax=uncultured Tenacibaculum sp. TaxID=174713 RepID=UPI0026314F4A|nr:DegT/DnrJ/EryC1/StrS family aminotransferase [uncultured Tenacibaculum sp.]
MNKRINVTKCFFPPLDEYTNYIEKAWKNEWLTNNGELYRELTEKLKVFLDVDHLIPMTNGTLPINIALNAFGNRGEIITTPFSYVATTASIVWENCTPVFVDIDPNHLTIDESKIENAITEKTTAIMATHVFGNPCEVDAINKIAEKHNLKVIYDAAHCFGVKYKNKSIFSYGDVSTCSFHATKLFHTGEGGAAICKDEKTYHEIFYRHNFGHNGPLDFHGLGINAKMSELQAAMGLSLLPYIDHIISERKKVCNFYDEKLSFKNFRSFQIRESTDWNYSYYPIIFDSEEILLEIEERFNRTNIYPRRYFYPSLEKLPYINQDNCPISEDISGRIMCLPLYVGLTEEEINLIVKLLNE